MAFTKALHDYISELPKTSLIYEGQHLVCDCGDTAGGHLKSMCSTIGGLFVDKG